MLETLEGIQREFNAAGGAQVSMADLIVLAGYAAVEKAARDAGVEVTRAVPRRGAPTPRRSRPTSTRSGCWSRGPTASATTCGRARSSSPRRCWWTGPTCSTSPRREMTVLVGGLRAMGGNVGGAAHGVLTDRPGVLTNDFFANLLSPRARVAGLGVGGERLRDPRRRHRRGEVDGHRGRPGVRLQLAAAGALRGLRQRGRREKFVRDFVAAWTKVMELDRFDLG